MKVWQVEIASRRGFCGRVGKVVEGVDTQVAGTKRSISKGVRSSGRGRQHKVTEGLIVQGYREG